MNEIVDLGNHRMEKELKDHFGEASLISPRPSLRWKNAFLSFVHCSGSGKKLQRKFLYEIINRYRLQRPISVDEMTDMLIAHFQQHAGYFEKHCGLSKNFDYTKEADLRTNKRTTLKCGN